MPTATIQETAWREAVKIMERRSFATVNPRNDFSAFCEECVRGRDGSVLRADIPVVKLIDACLEWSFEQRRHLSVVTCPGLFKSTRARGFLCYRLGKDPTLRIGVISSDLTTATRVVSSARNIVEDARYRKLFPEVIPDNQKNRKSQPSQSSKTMANQVSKFYLVNTGASPDPAMEAISIETSAEMRRLDIGLFDDASTRVRACSADVRKSTKDAFFQTFLDGRLRNHPENGLAIVINNLWHQDDLPSTLATIDRFTSVWIAVAHELDCFHVTVYYPHKDFPLMANPEEYGATRIEDDNAGNPVFRVPFPKGDKQWTPAALAQVERSNPYFTAQFLLKALADKDKMFPSWPSKNEHPLTARDLLLGHSAEGDLDNFRMPPERAHGWSFTVGMDFSSTHRKGDTIFLIASNGLEWFPVHVLYGNFTAQDRFEVLNNWWELGFKFCSVRLEDAGLQDALIKELKVVARNKRVAWAARIEGHKTTGNKYDPTVGLPVIDLEILNQFFLWPAAECEGESERARNWQRLERDMRECPKIPERNKTPDGVMTIWFGYRGLKERGRNTRRGLSGGSGSNGGYTPIKSQTEYQD